LSLKSHSTSIYPSVKADIEKPFEKKLKRTRQIIRAFAKLMPDSACVSCSFGKDSLAVLYLVREFLPKVAVLFCNTICQYPETYRFRDKIVDEWNLELFETKPKILWWQVWDKFGAPHGGKKVKGSSVDHCCYYLKEKPFKIAIRQNEWKVNFTGLTALESHQRMLSACESGMLFYSSKYGLVRLHPLIFWKEKEVWNFIEENSIPLNPAYKNRHLTRLGCMICTAHKGWRKEIAENNPRLYEWIQERYFNQTLLKKVGE